MATKQLRDNPAYDQCYHFIASTKYRKSVFCDERMRTRLSEIIESVVDSLEGTTCLAITVAYNHIHVLIKSDMLLSEISQRLFGVTSRIMRKEYPELLSLNRQSLWGGKSAKPIVDETHLQNCISYIRRHQPDNTKIEGE